MKSIEGVEQMDQIKVLFLAANPNPDERPKLDLEVREIRTKIRSADYSDSINFISEWAVRPDDLIQMLNQYNPYILHFSGHGNSSEGVTLIDDKGNPKPLNEKAIKILFKTLKANIKVVFLNACFSGLQAKAIIEPTFRTKASNGKYIFMLSILKCEYITH
jgi:CHAT domain-containing protein